MANNNIGQQAIAEMVKVFAQYADVVEEAVKANEAFKASGKVPSGFVEKIEKMSQAFVKLQATGQKLPPTINRYINANKKLASQQAREIKNAQRIGGAYSKLDAELKKLQKNYRDLAVKKELNGKLSKTQALELGRLEAKVKKYDATLKKVDASMGRHQRNVGNYGKAFDSLGFSVAQITRESPAFLNSLNTGFMAISNNIPILVDEINKLRAANVALAAEGKPTVNIMRRLGGALFSWQSAISAAIVALTVFGPKLIKLFQDLGKGNETLRDSKEILDELDETTVQSIGRLQSLVAVAKDVTQSEKDRKDAMEAINDEYDDLLGNLDDEEAAYEKLNGTVQDHIDLLVKQAQIQALEEKIGEKTLAILEARDSQKEWSNKLIKEGIEVNQDAVDSILKLDKATRDSSLTDAQREMALNELKEQLGDLDTRTGVYVGTLIAEQKAQDDLAELLNTILGLNIDLNSEDEEGNKLKRDKVELLGLESQGYNSIVLQLEEQIKFFEKINSLYADGTEEARFYTAEIAKLKVLLGEISALDESFTSAIGIDAAGSQGMKEGAQAIQAILRDMKSGGGDDDDKLGWVQYFNAIVPLAQSSLEAIQQFQRATTQQALADLEKQKDFAVKMAGESAEARAVVEEQYNEKRAEIQKKQAEDDKKFAIFKIAINTAQAVVSALASTPPNVPLSIIVGAIGAAQLALVASQPIPEFAEGVRDFGGGLAIVGDGGRSEVVRTPDGKVFKTPSKDTLVNLPKGSDVFSSEDEFNQELTKMLNMSMISNSPLISKPELTEESMSAIISRLEDTIRNKESIEIIEDERGKRVFKKRLNARTEILNNRRRIQGRGI